MSQATVDFITEKGAETIAEALSVDVGTVRVWKHRKSIPRTVWPELVQALPDVTLEKLVAMEKSA